MIRLIGTSHISPRSIATIKREIVEEKPDCVAVELDRVRYRSLKHGGKRKRMSLTFRIISWIQNKLGEKTGVFPGEEMLTAVETAKKEEIDVYLIDQPISETAKDFDKISFFDKVKLILTSINFGKPKDFNLDDVPTYDLVEKTIEHLRNKSPKIYNILVRKRDIVMSRAAIQLNEQYDDVLLVVGIGHVPGMKKIFESNDVPYIDKTF